MKNKFRIALFALVPALAFAALDNSKLDSATGLKGTLNTT